MIPITAVVSEYDVVTYGIEQGYLTQSSELFNEYAECDQMMN